MWEFNVTIQNKKKKKKKKKYFAVLGKLKSLLQFSLSFNSGS